MLIALGYANRMLLLLALGYANRMLMLLARLGLAPELIIFN
jgi:hypothetical protein